MVYSKEHTKKFIIFNSIGKNRGSSTLPYTRCWRYKAALSLAAGPHLLLTWGCSGNGLAVGAQATSEPSIFLLCSSDTDAVFHFAHKWNKRRARC
ncbi:hypothetical protein BaRGS_00016086 [Batillaria attramentaria]|uniref:Uncharacterized protein n=1 Tax=Batillaria attramentaria TaxID=370345 RepID=A0ABD0KZL3_9CAEN